MSTPAGWYPDPDSSRGAGSLRWWDGDTWTDHRQEADASQASGSPSGQSGQSAGSAAGTYGSPSGQSGQTSPQGWAAAPAAAGGWGQQPGQQPGQQGSWAGGKALATPAGEPLGSRGLRLAARIIDGLITSIVGGLIASPFFLAFFEALEDYLDEVTANPTGEAATNPFALYGEPGVLRNLALITLVTLLVSALYEIVFLALKGATPGKLAMGLRVRRWIGSDTAAAGLGWGLAAARWAIQVLPAQVVGVWSLLDAAWCLWDDRKQTLHDKIVKTVVVTTRQKR